MCTVGLFFSCTDYIWQDIESSRQSSNTNTELTVSVAKEWYENNYAPVVTVRSASQDSTLRPMKPDWKKAKESNRMRYEVVETPILTRGSHIVIDTETSQKWKPGIKAKFIRNVSKMVVMKDKETGEIRSFVMIFVGSYEYLQKSRTMNNNSYLYREPDFDGAVMFYEVNGTFINGWKYEKGKIIASLSPSIGKQKTDSISPTTRVTIQDCYQECYWYYDEECYDEVYTEESEYGTDYVYHHYCYPIVQEICYEHCQYL